MSGKSSVGKVVVGKVIVGKVVVGKVVVGKVIVGKVVVGKVNATRNFLDSIFNTKKRGLRSLRLGSLCKIEEY